MAQKKFSHRQLAQLNARQFGREARRMGEDAAYNIREDDRVERQIGWR